MGPELAPFAQFGIGGLAIGLVWVLGKWVLKRADADRTELGEVNTWAREKGWATMAEVAQVMSRNSDVTDRAILLAERLLDKLDASNPPVTRPADRRTR